MDAVANIDSLFLFFETPSFLEFNGQIGYVVLQNMN